MPINLGDFEIDPKTGEYRKVNRTESSGGSKPPRKARKPKSKGKRIAISAIITLLFGLVYYYLELPAINIHAGEMYIFIILLCAVFIGCELIACGFRSQSGKEYFSYVRKNTAVPFYIVCLCIAVALVGSIIGWKVFRARAYAELLPVENGDFATEVAEISFNQIPMLDKDSANVLANRKLGELSDLVSQFEVYGDSYQINYQNRPVRVTYLDYGDFFKWWGNTAEGIPAYMVIDMVTQEVNVARLEEGIRYCPSEYFFRDLNRHLRLSYPTKIFDDITFEVNEEGHPFWICSVVTPKVGLFSGMDAIGAVIMDAVSGECEYYELADVPTWVDRVFPSDLIISQYDYRGLYQNGFWNSLFGQSGCTETTSGYNYIAQNDDVYLYTGVTSVSGDQGNIGFILVNQRTKDAKYYSCAGAEEYSAMSSAQGAVQQYSYTATFPLLLNIGGQPTYFMALKDASQLVKMYAMVNVQQYQIVATGTSVPLCAESYENLLLSNGVIEGYTPPAVETNEVTGVIEDIRSAVIGGNTVYYLKLASGSAYYSISAAAQPDVVIRSVGDTVTVTYDSADTDGIIDATKVLSVGAAKPTPTPEPTPEEAQPT